MSNPTWPPGFTPDPTPLRAARSPMQYHRMRQTALDRGHTGTLVDTFKNPASNIPDASKGRLALPARNVERCKRHSK